MSTAAGPSNSSVLTTSTAGAAGAGASDTGPSRSPAASAWGPGQGITTAAAGPTAVGGPAAAIGAGSAAAGAGGAGTDSVLGAPGPSRPAGGIFSGLLGGTKRALSPMKRGQQTQQQQLDVVRQSAAALVPTGDGIRAIVPAPVHSSQQWTALQGPTPGPASQQQQQQEGLSPIQPLSGLAGRRAGLPGLNPPSSPLRNVTTNPMYGAQSPLRASQQVPSEDQAGGCSTACHLARASSRADPSPILQARRISAGIRGGPGRDFATTGWDIHKPHVRDPGDPFQGRIPLNSVDRVHLSP